MAPGGKVVDQSVSVQISGKNVGGSRLPVGKKTFLPRSLAVSGLFPEGEPLASGEFFSSLGAACDVGQAVPVDVAQAHVVGTARSILVGDDMAFPCLAGLGVVGYLQPDEGVGEGRVGGTTRVGDQVEFAVPVYVSRDQAVGA